MRTNCIPLLLVASTASLHAAGFDPIPLTPGSYNADVIVERTAPPPIAAGFTATMDGGTNLTGYGWYERGYNTASPSTGLPVAGSTFTHESDAAKQYTMPGSYVGNNALFLSSQVTSGTLTLSTPAFYAALSILSASGGGAATLSYTVHHADASTESGSIVSPDWFNVAGQAVTSGGRVRGDNATAFGDVGTTNPRLHSQEITVSSASEVTSIDFSYVSGGRCSILAVSGDVSGTWTPIALTGFNKDVVNGATETSPTALTTATTVSMDGGTGNTGNTWYERGYVPVWASSGLPLAGSTITSADPTKSDHRYLMAASYAAPNAIYVDATLTTANVTPASPQTYSAFSFLNATANGAVTCQAIMEYADGTTETNTFGAKDWFNGTPFAYRSDGRVSLNNRSLNNYNAGVNPRLYEAEFALGNAGSPVTNIILKWISGGATSRAVILAVSATAGALKPLFGLVPVPLNTYETSNVTFTAALAGGTTPIVFQWQKGTNGLFVNVEDGPRIAGSTTTNLSITNVTAAGDVADYQLIASNAAGAVTSAPVRLTILSSLPDITSPSDMITAVGGTSPAGEDVLHAIDNVTQKYLNYGSGPNPNNPPFVGPAGFVVTPAIGTTRVTGMRLYTANDHPQRDPADYLLEGSNDGTTFMPISSGPLALPEARNAGGAIALDPLTQALQQLLFDNPASYSTYRLTFTNVKDAVADNSMQIAEVELLGVAAPRLTFQYTPQTGDLILTWPGYASGYKLECSAVLPNTTWTEVPPTFGPGENPFDPMNPNYQWFGSVEPGNKFFRLRQPPTP